MGTERGQQSGGNSGETHDGCCFSDPYTSIMEYWQTNATVAIVIEALDKL